MKSILIYLSALLLIGNIFWAACFIRERNYRKTLEADLAAGTAANEHQAREIATVQKDVQAAINSQKIAGLYECKARDTEKYQELDLRSDGTGSFDNGYSGGNTTPLTWTKVSTAAISVG